MDCIAPASCRFYTTAAASVRRRKCAMDSSCPETVTNVITSANVIDGIHQGRKPSIEIPTVSIISKSIWMAAEYSLQLLDTFAAAAAHRTVYISSFASVKRHQACFHVHPQPRPLAFRFDGRTCPRRASELSGNLCTVCYQ
jgi:hypothetical protein